MQDSRERVDEIYHRLKSDGFEAEPPKEFHGAWTFYLKAPGGFLLEVGHQHRQGWLGPRGVERRMMRRARCPGDRAALVPDGGGHRLRSGQGRLGRQAGPVRPRI